MRLTDDELTRLYALERRLVAEDPPLARAFGNLQTPATGKLLQQLIVVGAVLSCGLGMLISGLVTDVMPLVVVGMLATTLFPVLTWRPYNWLEIASKSRSRQETWKIASPRVGVSGRTRS